MVSPTYDFLVRGKFMTIVKLYVAANQISPSGWGHLQIVGEDENGELFELEVQAGANWIV
ncbi:hypothetical protein RvVAT039_32890 [Agrobacterium vitis]|nr:hypothetical protein RvVAT039_32890 [Agrobacterium vitis]